jgi:hypothetical protein
MESNPTDPVIDEIRVVRRRISQEFGHDPAKLVAHYQQLQQKFRDRLFGADATALPGRRPNRFQ